MALEGFLHEGLYTYTDRKKNREFLENVTSMHTLGSDVGIFKRHPQCWPMRLP